MLNLLNFGRIVFDCRSFLSLVEFLKHVDSKVLVAVDNALQFDVGNFCRLNWNEPPELGTIGNFVHEDHAFLFVDDERFAVALGNWRTFSGLVENTSWIEENGRTL